MSSENEPFFLFHGVLRETGWIKEGLGAKTREKEQPEVGQPQ